MAIWVCTDEKAVSGGADAWGYCLGFLTGMAWHQLVPGNSTLHYVSEATFETKAICCAVSRSRGPQLIELAHGLSVGSLHRKREMFWTRFIVMAEHVLLTMVMLGYHTDKTMTHI